MITPAVTALRESLGFPGMVVLQFGFDPHAPRSVHRFENHVEDRVVYTGTHDHDTARGWYSGLSVRERSFVDGAFDRFGVVEREPWWSLIRLALRSPARVAMLQAQDVLGLGSSARMNNPGRRGGNWRWRMDDPTIIAGMMVGVATLAVILPSGALTWDGVVMVGGYWDMSLGQFMDLAHGMVVNGPVALLTVLAVDDARRDLQAWLALAMTLWLVRAIAVWLSGPPQGGSRLLLGEAATFVASIIGTVYLGPLLLWSLNRLNFWLLLIVIF